MLCLVEMAGIISVIEADSAPMNEQPRLSRPGAAGPIRTIYKVEDVYRD